MIISGLASIDSEQTWSEVLENQVPAKALKIGKWLLGIGLVFSVLAHLIPDQKQLAIIVGSGVTYNVLTSEPAKRIGGKSLELLEQQIDKALGGNESAILDAAKATTKAVNQADQARKLIKGEEQPK